MGMFSEFKDFINKGNMLDIAVGFVIGAAFTAVVTALVDNVIMPITAIPFGDAQLRLGADPHRERRGDRVRGVPHRTGDLRISSRS